MTNTKPRNKIQNLYLNQKTHATIKELAALQETTIQALAADWLQETQPILQNMVDALNDIKNGKEAQKTFNNYMAKGLRITADSLEDDEK